MTLQTKLSQTACCRHRHSLAPKASSTVVYQHAAVCACRSCAALQGPYLLCDSQTIVQLQADFCTLICVDQCGGKPSPAAPNNTVVSCFKHSTDHRQQKTRPIVPPTRGEGPIRGRSLSMRFDVILKQDNFHFIQILCDLLL